MSYSAQAGVSNVLFRDGLQLCSGLVDLVVGVGHHLGGGHRLTLAGERFVGRLTEDIAEVGDRRCRSRERPHQIRGLCPKPTRAVLPTSAGGTRSAASDGGKTRPKIE